MRFLTAAFSPRPRCCSAAATTRRRAACQMEVLAHLAPLPASDDPFDYQYSEVAARDGIAYLGAAHGAGVLVLDVTTGETLAVLDAGLGRNINSVAAAGNLLAFAPGDAGRGGLRHLEPARAPPGAPTWPSRSPIATPSSSTRTSSTAPPPRRRARRWPSSG